jgi:transposase-like protein
MSNFDITGIQDFRGLYKEMVGAFLEKGLEGELEEELGYSKYDQGNKETSNNWNGHTMKSLKMGNGLLEQMVPRDRDWEFKPRLVKKRQSSQT